MVVLYMGNGSLGCLYGSLSLSVTLRIKSSREGVEDRCLLSPLLNCGISPSKLGTTVRCELIRGPYICVVKVLQGFNDVAGLSTL